MVPAASFTSYYGRPILKPPTWNSVDIAGYLFLGGLAGGSSIIAAGALVTVIALILVLPLVLGNLPQEWAQDVAALLPGSSVIFLISGEGLSDGMTVASARTTMAAWAVAAIAAGGWRLRTDASR